MRAAQESRAVPAQHLQPAVLCLNLSLCGVEFAGVATEYHASYGFSLLAVTLCHTMIDTVEAFSANLRSAPLSGRRVPALQA